MHGLAKLAADVYGCFSASAAWLCNFYSIFKNDVHVVIIAAKYAIVVMFCFCYTCMMYVACCQKVPILV